MSVPAYTTADRIILAALNGFLKVAELEGDFKQGENRLFYKDPNQQYAMRATETLRKYMHTIAALNQTHERAKHLRQTGDLLEDYGIHPLFAKWLVLPAYVGLDRIHDPFANDLVDRSYSVYGCDEDMILPAHEFEAVSRNLNLVINGKGTQQNTLTPFTSARINEKPATLTEALKHAVIEDETGSVNFAFSDAACAVPLKHEITNLLTRGVLIEGFEPERKVEAVLVKAFSRAMGVKGMNNPA